jgi:Tfp pilus assembly protein PilE
MKKSQTGSAHVVIIIILVVAVLGLLGFVFWQNFIQKKDTTPAVTTTTKTADTTNSPAATTKTYKNTDLGFSVAYPTGWVLDTSKATNLVVGTLTSPNFKSDGSPDAASSDITIETQPVSGSTGQSSSLAVMALNGNAAEFASMKYTDTINGLAVTEFDMNSQTPYFAALFTIGKNYVELDFTTAPTKADLTSAMTAILKSVEAL